MTTATCRTCRWWRDGACDRVSDTEEPRATPESRGMLLYLYVPDDHGLSYALKTGPDFGCVLHEVQS